MAVLILIENLVSIQWCWNQVWCNFYSFLNWRIVKSSPNRDRVYGFEVMSLSSSRGFN